MLTFELSFAIYIVSTFSVNKLNVFCFVFNLPVSFISISPEITIFPDNSNTVLLVRFNKLG